MKNTMKHTLSLALAVAACTLILPVIANADDDAWKNPTDNMNVKIPGLTLSSPVPCPGDPTRMCVPWIGEYIAAVYKYGTGLAGTVAVVVMMFAGARWILAGGNPSTVADAKNQIMSALSGVVLLLASYTILNFINPDLVGLPSIGVKSPKPSANVAAGATGGTICQWTTNYCPESQSEAAAEKCGAYPDDTSEMSLISVCCCTKAYPTGVCQPIASGPCSEAQLEPVFGLKAAQASAICRGESGGNASIGSGVDKTVDGKSVSIGLFQINLTVHTIGGLDCPSAFSGPYNSSKSRVTIEDQSLYDQCVAVAQNPSMNIAKAKAIFDVRGSWRPWGYNTSVCKYP